MRCVAVACLLVAAACRFDPHRGDDTSGGGTDAQHAVTIIDDTTDDFARGIATEGVVTPWGTVEPAAFVVGGLHARGFDATMFADTDTFDQALAKAGAARGSGYRQLPVDWGFDRPHGLGIANSDNYGVAFDGEILLPPGALDLQVDVDDRAVVEIALDGANFSTRLAGRVGQVQKITLDTGAGGWFPLRAMFGEDSVTARFVLSYVQAGATVAIGPERLRARVTNALGLVAFGFDGQAFTTARGEAAVARVDETFGISAPAYDLGMGFDRFSLRYVGQLLADSDADYALAVDVGADPTDGFRLFVDGNLIASRWLGTPNTPSATVHLARGWHDLLVDYSENQGDARVALKMNGAIVDPTHLRPAVANGLTSVFFDPTSRGIPDPGTLALPMPITATSALARIDFVDYGLRISNHPLTKLTGELDDCKGALALQLLPANQYSYFAVDKRCAGLPAMPATPFMFKLVDAMGGDSPAATASEWGVAITYHGGDRTPFATVWEYVSAAKPTPSAASIDKITVDGALQGAKQEVFVRTGADEAAVAAAAWALVQADGVPGVPASAFVQYKIALVGDGWQYPVIDRVAIDYTVAN
jgi:hypothetical protein